MARGCVRGDGAIELAGMVMAHEIGHCFSLRHRCREEDEEWGDAVSTRPGRQLPDYGVYTNHSPDNRENLENLMYHGYRGQDWRKGDMDLLQAVGMRGLPADPGQWSGQEE